MLKVDLHIHSIASGHSISTVNEIVNFAKNNNMTHIAITEHGPSMVGAPHQDYFWISNRLPTSFGRLKVFFGCEANIVDINGRLDLEKEHLENQAIIIAGLHEKTPFPINLGKQQNTMAIVNAISNKRVSIISHPLRPEFPVDINDLTCAAAKNNVILELNTQVLKRVAETAYLHEYKNLVKLAKEREVLLIINSDAHAHYFIGDEFVLKKLGKFLELSPKDLLNYNQELLVETLELHKNA